MSTHKIGPQSTLLLWPQQHPKRPIQSNLFPCSKHNEYGRHFTFRHVFLKRHSPTPQHQEPPRVATSNAGRHLSHHARTIKNRLSCNRCCCDSRQDKGFDLTNKTFPKPFAELLWNLLLKHFEEWCLNKTESLSGSGSGIHKKGNRLTKKVQCLPANHYTLYVLYHDWEFPYVAFT